MTEVLLVNPPRQKNGNASLFNNSLLWLASYLEKNGIKTKVISLRYNFEEYLIRQLEEYKPTFVGISCKWWDTLYSSEYIAAKVKEFNKNIVVFCGGQTATVYSKEILVNTLFDAVIEGDAELPLFNFIKGKELLNCKIKKEGEIISYPKTYIHTDTLVSELELSDNITGIYTDWANTTNYIWTGKGCAMNCFFCGGGREGQSEVFGRKGYVYRNVEKVIHDIELTAPLKNNLIMMDFDPLVSSKNKFYKELFSKLPKKKYSCEFYFWSFPDDNFLDLITETFEYLIFEFDLQIFSEPLRKKLAGLNFIKPKFFTNNDFERLLKKCHKKGNIAVNIAGLIGVPFETRDDLNEIYTYSDKLISKFNNLYNITLSPVIIEPASPMLNNPDKYGLECLRNTYEDFRNYTRDLFENNQHEKPVDTFEKYLKYTGVIRKGFDEEEIFKECFRIQKEITERTHKNLTKQ